VVRKRYLLALLALPALAAPIALRILSDGLARSAAAAIARGGDELATAMTPEASDESGTSSLLPGIGDEANVCIPRPVEADRSAPARPRGIFVRAPVVARAIEGRSLPGATPVPASGLRPAGLSITGVSGYGTAIRDGDVLTSIAGTRATSPAAAIAAAKGAARSKARAIGAVIWRKDQRFEVTIELPPR
jgi:hypothetical protein